MKKAKQNNPPAKPGRPTHAEAQNESPRERFLERGREGSVFALELEIRRIPGSDPPTFGEPCGARVAGLDLDQGFGRSLIASSRSRDYHFPGASHLGHRVGSGVPTIPGGG